MRKTFEDLIEEMFIDTSNINTLTKDYILMLMQQVRIKTLEEVSDKADVTFKNREWEVNKESILNLDKNSIEL